LNFFCESSDNFSQIKHFGQFQRPILQNRSKIPYLRLKTWDIRQFTDPNKQARVFKQRLYIFFIYVSFFKDVYELHLPPYLLLAISHQKIK